MRQQHKLCQALQCANANPLNTKAWQVRLPAMLCAQCGLESLFTCSVCMSRAYVEAVGRKYLTQLLLGDLPQLHTGCKAWESGCMHLCGVNMMRSSRYAYWCRHYRDSLSLDSVYASTQTGDPPQTSAQSSL